MTASYNNPVDTALVARLIAMRTTPADDTPCPEIHALAAVLAGRAAPEVAAVAEEHLSRCPSCRAAMLTLGRLASDGTLGPLPTLDGLKSPPRRRHRVRASRLQRHAAAAGVALLLGAGLYWRLASRPDGTQDAPLSVKGEADELHVAVQRGGDRFRLRPGAELKTGDTLGFFYSAEEKGYLAVFGVDESGETATLYPAGETHSAPVSSGRQAPLPDGAVVGEGEGCEWFVAVFSEVSLDLEALRRAIADGESGEDCRLALRIPGARTVFVLPYARKSKEDRRGTR